jgi:DNA (cytosine-5)-methyltransferase 1
VRIGTLFSGGLGAPEQALKQMGWKHENIFACEWDKFARQNHEANHDIPDGHFHKDINDMGGKQYAGKIDVIVGGSPCQDFSIAGLRAGVDGHRGQLIWQYFRIVDEARPPIFVYENVKGMVSDNAGRTLKDFLEIFRSIGYHCHAEVLNTKHYGVPQNRERIYIVGFLDHSHYHRFEYAPKVKLEKRLKDVLEDEVDEKWYLSEKFLKYMTVTHQENHADSFGGRFKLIELDGIANCLRKSGDTCPTDTYFDDGNGVRRPTSREKFRLQGCDDSFNIDVSDARATMAAGNGMSVNVLEMLFRQIKKAQSDKPTGTLLDFA